MTTKVQKPDFSELRAQFARDLARLRLKYENLELSRKSGIDPANLSSYGSGKKNPGRKVLIQFYEAFASEIPNPFEDHEPTLSREFDVAEPTTAYRERNALPAANDLIETLKLENTHLRKSVETLLAANEKLVHSTLMLAESNRKLAEHFITKNVS